MDSCTQRRYIHQSPVKLLLVAAECLHYGHCQADGPYFAFKLLSTSALLTEVAEIAYSHHESYDGTGYPRGLRGDEIPLGARIVAIANTLDSITSDLPYRRRRTLKEAKDEILRCSGTQFDPQIVEVFLQMPDALWDDLKKQCEDHTE